MSYFLFPTNKNEVFFTPILDNIHTSNYTSHSLHNYCKNLQKDLNKLFIKTGEPNEYFYYLLTIVNPYYFVTKYVNENEFIKPKVLSNVFFDLLEIFKMTKLFEDNDTISSMHIGSNIIDACSSLELMREKCKDKDKEPIKYYNIHNSLFENESEHRFDYLYCEVNNNINYGEMNDYIISLLEIVMIILKYQILNGCSVIKIDNLFYKPTIDILYLICSLYDKVYIVKPTTSNPITFERYIVCKNFLFDDIKKDKYKEYYFKIGNFICDYNSNPNKQNILHIINKDIPYYFLNKVNDMNIMIGHQQIESINVLFSILNSKNKQDKIEYLKKNHIQKCISWCEKMSLTPSQTVVCNYGNVEPI